MSKSQRRRHVRATQRVQSGGAYRSVHETPMWTKVLSCLVSISLVIGLSPSWSYVALAEDASNAAAQDEELFNEGPDEGLEGAEGGSDDEGGEPQDFQDENAGEEGSGSEDEGVSGESVNAAGDAGGETATDSGVETEDAGSGESEPIEEGDSAIDPSAGSASAFDADDAGSDSASSADASDKGVSGEAGKADEAVGNKATKPSGEAAEKTGKKLGAEGTEEEDKDDDADSEDKPDATNENKEAVENEAENDAEKKLKAEENEPLDVRVEIEDASSYKATEVGVEYYQAGSLTINASISPEDNIKSYEVAKINQSGGTESASGDLMSATFSESETNGKPLGVRVTAKANDEQETETTTYYSGKDGAGSEGADGARYVVLDTTVPTVDANSSKWGSVNLAGVDDVLATQDADDTYKASFVTAKENADKVNAVAHIVVKDYNLNANKEVSKITLDSEDFEISGDYSWNKVGADAYAADVPVKNAGKLAAGAYELTFKVTAKDLAENGITDEEVKFTVDLTVDEDAPSIEVKKGDDAIASGSKAYFKEGEQAAIAVTEDHFKAENLTATLKDSDGSEVSGGLAGWSGDSSPYQNATSMSQDGTYTLTIGGKDAVGNKCEDDYEATLVYDATLPEVEGTYKNAANEVATANGSGTICIKEDTQLTLEFTEDNLDTGGTTVLVGGEGPVALDSLGGDWNADSKKATVTLPADEEGATYDVEVSMKDLAGNKKTFKQEVTVDKTAPTFKIDWGTETGVRDGDSGNYTYKSRTATLTITEANFDPNKKPAVTLNGLNGSEEKTGTIGEWSETSGVWTADVAFSETADDYQIVLSYSDPSGQALVPVEGGIEEGATLTDGTYTSTAFNVLAKPSVEVTYSPEMIGNLADPSVNGFALGSDDALTFTIVIKDTAFVADNIEATSTPGTGATLGDAIDWDSTDASVLTHTGTISYTGEGKGITFTVNDTSASPREYTGQSSLGVLYKLENFWIDGTPPTIATLTYDPDTTPIDKVRYYGKSVTSAVKASISIDEWDLNVDGTPVVVTVTKEGVSGSNTEELILDDDKKCSYDFSATDGEEAKYTLTLDGTDLAKKVLVKGDTVESIIGDEAPFTSTVVLDKKSPTVEVSYVASDSTEKAIIHNESENVDVVKNGVTVNLKFTDSFLDKDNTKVTVDGQDVGLTWGEGSNTATFTIDEPPSDVEKTCEIRVTAKDLAGNDLSVSDNPDETEFVGYIKLDTKAPELVASIEPKDGTQTRSDSDATNIQYYEAMVATLTVKDSNLLVTDDGNLNNMTVKLDGDIVNASWSKIQEDPEEWQLVFDSDGLEYGPHTLEVSGTDKVGNGLVSGDEGATAVEGGKYTYNFMLDPDSSHSPIGISVDWVDKGKVANEEGPSVYTSRTATVTITGANFDKDKVTISATRDGESVDLGNITWSPTDGNELGVMLTHKAAIPSFTESGTYVFTVTAQDGFGHPDDPVEYTDTFEIDTTPPEFKASYTPADSARVKIVNERTANEVRYYGSADGNAKVGGTFEVTDQNFDADSLKVTVNGGSALDFTGDKPNYKATKSFDKDGEYVIVAGTKDKLGNKMVSGDEGNTYVSSDGVYKTKIVLDRVAPKISVKYSKGDSTKTATLKNEGTAYSSETVTATVTVTDVNFNPDTTTIETKGKTSGSWKDVGDNKYEITITYRPDKGDTVTYPLKVKAVDWAQNPEEYSAEVVIDQEAPTMRVSYNPGAENYDDRATAKEVRYYGPKKTVRAKVIVKDFSHDMDLNNSELVVFNYKGKVVATSAGNTWAVSKSGSGDNTEWTYVATLDFEPPEKDTIYTFTVNGADAAGNKIVSSDPNTFVAKGSYQTKLYFDVTNPQLKVTWGDKARNGMYYNKDRKARIVITDANLDYRYIKIDGKSTDEKKWTISDKKLVYETIVYDKDGSYRLTIEGKDRAGNVLSGGDDAKPKDTQRAKTNAKGVYKSAKFIIDKVSPVITMNVLNQKLSRNVSGVDYYNSAKRLTMQVNVTEKNFDPLEGKENTRLKLSGKYLAAYNDAKWKDGEGNLRTYMVSFGENDSAEPTSDVGVVAYDLAGNVATYSYGDAQSTKDKGNGIVSGGSFSLDVTAPTLEPGNGNNVPSAFYSNNYGGDLLFYNEQVGLSVVARDAVGMREMYTSGDTRGVYAKSVNPNTYGGKTNRLSIDLEQEGNEYTDGVILTAVDNANNARKWKIRPHSWPEAVDDVAGSSKANIPIYASEPSLYPEKLIEDTVAPSLTFSAPAAGEFFNTDQSVTLDVVEQNFEYLKNGPDSGQVVITMTKYEGNEGRAQSTQTTSVSEFGGSGTSYSHTTNLSDDGHYSFTAELTDPAGNHATAAPVEEFTIDKTAPTCEITFDNNNSTDGVHFGAARTATIVVTEHNFEGSSFPIDAPGASISGWSDAGDRHTATVTFSEDGHYTLSVSGTDRAGNAMQAETVSEFVIDKTAPEIEFLDVEAETAYNDTIAPRIVFRDNEEIDASPGRSGWVLTGNKNGDAPFVRGDLSGGTQATVGGQDFDRTIVADDIYTLTANLTDMAGNTAEESITFSVNRFGSNFIVQNAERYKSGYLSSPPEVVVKEINVNGVDANAKGEKQHVKITHGLKTDDLKKQAENASNKAGTYGVDTRHDVSGWAEYEYHIPSANFSEDGNYQVVISSDDAAGNKNTSTSYSDPKKDGATSNAGVSFILDTNPPIIDAVSVENGSMNDSELLDVTFSVIENIGVKSVTAVLDGQAVDVVSDNGLYTVSVPAAAFTERNLEITATDLADQSATTALERFHVTTDFFELHWPILAGFAVLVIAGGAAGIVAVRRRNEAALEADAGK